VAAVGRPVLSMHNNLTNTVFAAVEFIILQGRFMFTGWTIGSQGALSDFFRKQFVKA
jgi:hypothetical protein